MKTRKITAVQNHPDTIEDRVRWFSHSLLIKNVPRDPE